MDFMGPLPVSNSYDYLLVVIDRLTSQVHLLPTTTHATSKEVAWTFLKEIVRLHGVPDSIVSDRDTKFTSSFWKELHQLMGTKFLMSTAFHPQTDGATEWENCSVGQVLRALVRNDQKDWENQCPIIEFALNSSISSSMGYAPFELNYGSIPQLGQQLGTDTKFASVKQFAQQVQLNLMMVHHTNHHRWPGKSHSPGDLVCLSTKNLLLPKGQAKK